MTTPEQPPQAPPPADPLEQYVVATLVAAILGGWLVAKLRNIMRSVPAVDDDAVTFMLRQPVLKSLMQMDNYLPANRVLAAQRRQNAFRRAAYLVAAARRLTTAIRTGDPAKIGVAWAREQNYLGAHLQANHKRNSAAIAVAKVWTKKAAKGQEDSLLGWYAVRDSRTSADCWEAHGRNFNPQYIPPIGYPGAVHPNCRCLPGSAFDTDMRVEDLISGFGMYDGVVAASTSGWSATRT